MILASTPRGVVRLRDELIQAWNTHKDEWLADPTLQKIWMEQGEVEAIRRAELLWVSAEMGTLLNTAQKTLPVDTIIRPDDLPSDFGFVVFEEPLVCIDATRDEPMIVRAFMWANARIAGENALHMSFYVDSDKYPALAAIGLHLAYAGASEWFMNTDLNAFPAAHYEAMTEHALESIREDRRIFGSLLMLLHQPLVVEGLVKAGRQERRQAERHGQPAPPDVRVLTLRLPQHQYEDKVTSRVQWTHRWLVSGHWRKQWYATEQVHRPIWIAPFIKGPAEKELFVRPTVRAWRR